MRSRTWLLLAVCVVIFLGIGLWTRGAKKEVKKEVLPEVQVLPEVETLQEPQQAVTEVLPKKRLEEPAEVIQVIIFDEPAEIEEDIIEEPSDGLVAIRGQVNHMDPCTQSITVDGTTVDVSHGNFPMYRTYQIGDFVEVIYREKSTGNVLESIELLQER